MGPRSDEHFIEEEEEEEFPPPEYEPGEIEWEPVWDDDDNFVLDPIARRNHQRNGKNSL